MRNKFPTRAKNKSIVLIVEAVKCLRKKRNTLNIFLASSRRVKELLINHPKYKICSEYIFRMNVSTLGICDIIKRVESNKKAIKV